MYCGKLKKENRFNLRSIVFVILGLQAFLLIGCYEQQEGCLDPNAVNFDPSADLNTDCKYPSLNLTFDANGPERGFSYDSVFYDSEGIPYEIVYAGIYVQAFEIEVDGSFQQLSGIEHSVVQSEGAEISYAEDVSLLEPRTFTNTIDSIIQFEAFESVRTKIGLGELGKIDTAQIPERSVLSSSELMQHELGIYDYMLIVDLDTSANRDMDTISGSLSSPQIIDLSVQGIIEPATNIDWIVEVYYDQWLSDFNLNDDIATKKAKLESGFSDLISLVVP